jgi:hypothetical protein
MGHVWTAPARRTKKNDGISDLLWCHHHFQGDIGEIFRLHNVRANAASPRLVLEYALSALALDDTWEDRVDSYAGRPEPGAK